MLSQKQVAIVLGVSVRTVRRLTRKRVLRAMWYEGVRALRYPEDDLKAYLKRTAARSGQERTKRA